MLREDESEGVGERVPAMDLVEARRRRAGDSAAGVEADRTGDRRPLAEVGSTFTSCRCPSIYT